jgi:hypothetical protein
MKTSLTTILTPIGMIGLSIYSLDQLSIFARGDVIRSIFDHEIRLLSNYLDICVLYVGETAVILTIYTGARLIYELNRDSIREFIDSLSLRPNKNIKMVISKQKPDI